MNETAVDLTNCDREPIHIPGSIQPHGVMLVVERNSLSMAHAAGDVEGRLGVAQWQGRGLGLAIGDTLAQKVARMSDSGAVSGFVGQLAAPTGEAFDISAHLSGDWLIVELEPAPADPRPASAVLGDLSNAGAAFERATNLKSLCERAAIEFRKLTGFDRVMIYQFLDDAAGAVLAEDKVPELPSFLNHHFPGTDIPRQARALYVRNLVRTIPDVRYTPSPLRPAWREAAPLDMSDSVLRSVSPIHMQYMQNMGVAASASISIVKDGVLWGLIACHHRTPRLLEYDVRAACASLAGGLSRQIKAKEEAELYRERIRLRRFEDTLVGGLSSENAFDEALAGHMPDLARMLVSDGAAALRGDVLNLHGVTPPARDVKRLASWVLERGSVEPVVTEALSDRFPAAVAYQEEASGLLAVVIAADEPFVMMWFRAEKVQVVEWAGNPHRAADLKPGEALSPRASFEAWRETVRGRSAEWTLPEVEAALRLKQAILELRRRERTVQLNRTLTEAVAAKDALLEQKGYLLREVNHRVQNSLQLVSAFLELQSRALDDPRVKAPFDEARRRLTAVAMVHRRLYSSDQIEMVDLARYLEELVGEMLETMDPEWEGQIKLDLAPVMMGTDRAVTLGLVLTELVINANKYAYAGAPGPLEIGLEQSRNALRLIVADRGGGKHTQGSGFGTRMMKAMVGQLSGELDYQDNKPGLRAVVTAPITSPN